MERHGDRTLWWRDRPARQEGEMATLIHCPACRRNLKLPAGLEEREVRCPVCGAAFVAGRERPTLLSRESRPAAVEVDLPACSGRLCPDCGEPVGLLRQCP